jgi:AcrR family transcriptional regulator
MDAPSRRETILNACERLLHRKGPGKTTMHDVAKEARVAVGSVYLEFDSKEAIVEELSSRKHDAVLTAIARGLASDGPYAERFRSAIDARTEAYLTIAKDGSHACELVHCSRDGVQTALQRFKAAEHNLFCELLRAGARAGELDVDKPELVTRVVLIAYARFTPPWLFSSSREESLLLLRALHDVVLDGLVKRKRR